MRLSQKLIASISFVTVVSIAVTSIAAIFIASEHNNKTAYKQISSLADGRRNQLDTFLQGVSTGLESFANSKLAISTINLLVNGIEFADPDTLASNLTAIYLADGKSPEEIKDIEKISKLSIYTKNHKKKHKDLIAASDDIGAQNIHLTDNKGVLIYSAIKRADFGSNLLDGAFNSSPLASITQDVFTSPDPKTEYFKEFTLYEPNGNEPTSFLARSIVRNGELKGVVIVELPAKRLNEILNNSRGLGRTGETILVNSEGLLLSDSKHTDEIDTLNVRIRSELIASTTDMEVQTGVVEGFRNIEADAGFAKINFSNAGWFVAAIIDRDESGAGIAAMRNAVLIIAIALLFVSLGLAYWIARSLTRPIHSIIDNMNELADGNTAVELSDDKRKDEVGDIIRAVIHFKDTAIEKLDLEEETKQVERIANDERIQREQQKEREAQELQRAISELAVGLERLADGDLVSSIDANFNSNMEPLRYNFNTSVDKLCQTMRQITLTANAIKDNSADISNATHELSKRTEGQAASLEEAAAALTQLTESVHQAASRANESAQLAQAAKTNTDKSGKVVSDAIAAMGRIENASQGISSIIEVIEALSFQTNLLALNAGVEAARAGEAGKGFAVVAQEVRELASRSSEAAQQIKQLIDTSTSEVEEGVVLVKKTGVVLEEISSQVTSVESQIADIAKSSGEQLESLQSVTTSVNHMDQRTQQNAAMAEESTAATQNLDSEIRNLSDMVAAFKVKGSDQKPVAYEEAKLRLIS